MVTLSRPHRRCPLEVSELAVNFWQKERAERGLPQHFCHDGVDLKDPYLVLGVARTAPADEIKRIYRSLARELHPDTHPNDRKAEERFKDVTAAYEFLSDAERRAKFDRGDIDASGAPLRRSQSRRTHGFEFNGEAEDIFAELLRRKEKGRRSWGRRWGSNPGEDEPPPPGDGPAWTNASEGHNHAKVGYDAHHTLHVSLNEAAAGATKRVALATGRSVDIRVPQGCADGQTLRLRGQGFPGPSGAPAGDAYVEIKVHSHPHLVRKDDDYTLDLPISVQEAMLGGKVTVPTIDGKVAVTIPPGSNTGTVLRLKGKGVPGPGGSRGDQLVTLSVVLPEDDLEFRKFVEKWGAKNGYDVRTRHGL